MIYAPRKLRFPTSSYTEYNIEVIITIRNHCKAYFCSKYKINQFQSDKNRLWIGILNKSFFKDIVIDRGNPLRFFIVESAQQYSVKHETKNRRSSTKKKYRKRKWEGFLNRYHFAYAGRAVVNQFRKFVLRLMKIASSEINNIAQQGTNQVICQGRQEIERILPKKIFT